MGEEQPAVGRIGWIDLTVPDALAIRDFYQAVVGWRAEPVEMGDYSDYSMLPPGSSMFSRRSAVPTSTGVNPRALSAFASSHTRIA